MTTDYFEAILYHKCPQMFLQMFFEQLSAGQQWHCCPKQYFIGSFQNVIQEILL